jgi:hypothetical protein
MLELLRRSAELGLEVPTIASTDDVNTILPEVLHEIDRMMFEFNQS